MSHVEGDPDLNDERERASSEVDRPTGVVLLALLYGIGAVASVLFAGAFLVGAIGGAAFGVPLFAGIAIMGALVFLAVAVATAAIAMGLWKRKRAAWHAAVALAAGYVAWSVLGLFVGNVIDGVVGLAIAGLVLWYLFQPTVQAWFGIGGVTTDRYGRPT